MQHDSALAAILNRVTQDVPLELAGLRAVWQDKPAGSAAPGGRGSGRGEGPRASRRNGLLAFFERRIGRRAGRRRSARVGGGLQLACNRLQSGGKRTVVPDCIFVLDPNFLQVLIRIMHSWAAVWNVPCMTMTAGRNSKRRLAAISASCDSVQMYGGKKRAEPLGTSSRRVRASVRVAPRRT